METKMMRKKIVFWGRPCHVRTSSDVFLLDILKEIGDVEVIRDEIMTFESAQRLRDMAPDLIVFFQLYPNWRWHTLLLSGIRKVWVPMWDTYRLSKCHTYLSYRLSNIDMISFAEPVHEHLSSWGLSSLRVRFFPKPNPAPIKKKNPPYTAFFWQRQVDIDLNFVAKIFPPGYLSKVIFKRDVPGYPVDSFSFSVEEMPSWSSKESLYNAIKSTDYYIAPRWTEGIGFGFLEAMSLGRVVVASHEHTMTDYIQEGVTGHFFNGNGRISEKWVTPDVIQTNLIDYSTGLYEMWLNDKQRIKAFLS